MSRPPQIHPWRTAAVPGGASRARRAKRAQVFEITGPETGYPTNECPSDNESSQKRLKEEANRRLGQPKVMGIDCSLKGTGVVAVPLDWIGNWGAMPRMTAGYSVPASAPDAVRTRRLEYIAEKVVSFAREHRVETAWIESYAFGRSTAAHALGEIGGVLRVELRRAGVEVRVAPISSARKLLLGELPLRDAKRAINEFLNSAPRALPFTLDESDAFVAMNWGLAQIGAFHVSGGAWGP